MTALLSLVAAAAFAAAPAKPAAKPAQLPGDEIELKADDGWALKGRYHAALEPGKLTVVLLHGRGTRKEVWRPVLHALDKAGYGWLALDLRGHGESQTAPDGQVIPWRKLKATAKGENDYAKMALDVQAAVSYLAQHGPIDESAVALVGQDVGGSVALRYAAVHPKIPLVAMLSPGLSYQEVTTVNAMRAYKERPILMIYGTLDRYASSSAPILYQFAKISVGEQRAALVAVPDVHGKKLASTPSVIAQLIDWLGNPVPPPPAVSTATAPGGEPQPGQPGQTSEPAPDSGQDAEAPAQ